MDSNARADIKGFDWRILPPERADSVRMRANCKSAF